MAISFPLSKDDFLTLLRVQEVQFQLGGQRQITGLAGGEILAAEVAPPLWEGMVSLPTMRARDAAGIQALLAAREVPGRKVEVFTPNPIGPAAAPLGAALAGFSPGIEALQGDNQRLRLSGLPADFTLTAGDFLAFDYDPGTGTRRALHQVVEGRSANGTGEQTLHMTVTPALRAGVVAGAAVALVRPLCLAVLVPGSVSYGTTVNGKTGGMSFQFRQSLRG